MDTLEISRQLVRLLPREAIQALYAGVGTSVSKYADRNNLSKWALYKRRRRLESTLGMFPRTETRGRKPVCGSSESTCSK